MKSITKEIINSQERLRDYDRDMMEIFTELKDDLGDPIVLTQLAMTRNAMLHERRLLQQLEAEWFEQQWEAPR